MRRAGSALAVSARAAALLHTAGDAGRREIADAIGAAARVVSFAAMQEPAAVLVCLRASRIAQLCVGATVSVVARNWLAAPVRLTARSGSAIVVAGAGREAVGAAGASAGICNLGCWRADAKHVGRAGQAFAALIHGSSAAETARGG